MPGQQRRHQAPRDLFSTRPARSVAASITSVPSTPTNQGSQANTLRRSPGKGNLKVQRHKKAKKPSPQTFIYLNEKPQTQVSAPEEEMWFHPRYWSCCSDYGSEYFAAYPHEQKTLIRCPGKTTIDSALNTERTSCDTSCSTLFGSDIEVVKPSPIIDSSIAESESRSINTRSTGDAYFVVQNVRSLAGNQQLHHLRSQPPL